MAEPTSFQDFQNFNIDLSKLYTEIVTNQIDKYRSNADLKYVLTGLSSKEADVNYIHASAVNLETQPPIGGIVPPYYESRCHAFYRSIGLPVVDPTGENDYFNPGYNPELNTNADKISRCVNISNNFIKSELGKISINRQDYLLRLLDIFSVSDINSTVLSLSLINKRKLSNIMEKNVGNTLGLQANDQDYVIDYTDANNDDMLAYVEYINGSTEANLPNKLSTFNSKVGRKHIIRPFITDPRLAFTAKSKSFNVPFLQEPSSFSPPILEKVCRERFSVASGSALLSAYEKATLDYAAQQLKIDSSLTSTFGDQGIIERKIYVSFINYSRALSKKIKQNIKIIKQAQTKYHLLPIPSSNGPEFGLKTSQIEFQDTAYNTDLDKLIINLSISDIISNLESSIKSFINPNNNNSVTAAASPITGKTAISIFPTDITQTIGSGNNVQSQLKSLTGSRDKIFKQVNQSLQELEYALGEFSGLGLCDIYIIQTALYLIKKEALLGLLDTDARERMKKNQELNTGLTPLGIIASLNELENITANLYQIFDQIYEAETDAPGND